MRSGKTFELSIAPAPAAFLAGDRAAFIPYQAGYFQRGLA